MKINKDKSLDQIENSSWGSPPPNSTGLIKTCHKLRTKKIKDFSVSDYRIMLGQSISLNILVSLVIEILKKTPFIEADYYEGDLFMTLMKKTDRFTDFWKKNPLLKEEVIKIFESNLEELENLAVGEEIKNDLKNLFFDFKSDNKEK